MLLSSILVKVFWQHTFIAFILPHLEICATCFLSKIFIYYFLKYMHFFLSIQIVFVPYFIYFLFFSSSFALFPLMKLRTHYPNMSPQHLRKQQSRNVSLTFFHCSPLKQVIKEFSDLPLK
jgi:hypothetical protein